MSSSRVKFLLHCWLLLLSVAALCDEAAAQATRCGSVSPDQVDRVENAGVTSSGVSFIQLFWFPPPDVGIRGYYYTLSCPACPTADQVRNITAEQYRYDGLPAATEYNISVQAGYQNCSLSPPFDVSGKTALTNLQGPVRIADVTETSFRAHWAASPDAGVRYEVRNYGLTDGTSVNFTGLQSGSTTVVAVLTIKSGFPESNFIFGTALTKLYAVDSSSASFGITETAISASWRASDTAGVTYQLTCSRVGSSEVVNVPSSTPTATCGSLQSGAAYELAVAVQKVGGFADAVTRLPTQLTKLSAVDVGSVLFDITDTDISASWRVSASAGVTYQLTCSRVGSGEVRTDRSSSPSATCRSLQSGAAYELAVAVQKVGGFADAVTRLPTQLTKLNAVNASSASFLLSETAISASWGASATAGVVYTLMCSRVGSSDVKTVRSSSPSATCDFLQPGEAHILLVIVNKDGGFDDAVTRLPDQLTNDSSAVSVTALQLQSDPGRAVRFCWTPPSAVDGRGVVFEYALRLDGPGGCAAARLLNCPDCRRHRDQMHSLEARQWLEQLTASCAATLPSMPFGFYDSRVCLEFPVNASGHQALRPWTEYSASLWPVNRAGPGAVSSVSFRSPEVASGAVRNLRATAKESEAMLEFEKPELPNGVLMAFAVQLRAKSSSECSELLVLNSSSALCQLPMCQTDSLIQLLAAQCSTVRYINGSSSENGSSLTVTLRQLQPGSEYTVRVTPVSQSLVGASAEVSFGTSGGDGSVSVIVAAVLVPLALLVAVAAALFLWRRRLAGTPQKTVAATRDAADGHSGSTPTEEYDTISTQQRTSDYVYVIPSMSQRSAETSFAKPAGPLKIGGGAGGRSQKHSDAEYHTATSGPPESGYADA